MLNEKFLEVIAHEGVAAIVSTGKDEAHVANTWNSYLVVDGDKIYVPAAGMRKTQQNLEENHNVKMTVGSREVMGLRYMGAGFLLEGTARFHTCGVAFDMMKEKFPFLSRVLEIEVVSAKQTL